MADLLITVSQTAAFGHSATSPRTGKCLTQTLTRKRWRGKREGDTRSDRRR